MIQILVKFNNNTIMTSKLKDVLKQYQVPLLHGTHGSGKTTLVRKTFKECNFHLFCPLEPNEWTYMIDGISNNPKQFVIIDNLEAADSATLKQINQFLNKKKKSTSLILICVDPYTNNLRTLRSKLQLVRMPTINKANAILRAEELGASKEILSYIAKNGINDYRLLENLAIHGGSLYDSDTNHAIRNPFKAFSWLLGQNNKANLESVVEDNPYFYSCGIFTNYTKVSNNIDTIEQYSKHLSDIDNLGFDVSNIQNTLLSKLSKLKKVSKPYMIQFPKFNVNSKELDIRFWRTIEHRDSLSYLIRYINKNKPPNKTLEFLKNCIKYYKIHPDIAEKALIILGDTKKPKLRVHIKKLFS